MRALGIAAIVIACSGKNETPPTTIPTGTKFDDCAEDSVPKLGGGCTKIGVPECPKGFAADGQGGCKTTLPACEKGLFAAPGDDACHEVMACGDVPTGDVYVDAAFTGVGDGTKDKPFNKLQAAITAARPNATIVLADGVYNESVVISTPVKVRGRCPSKVEIKGTDARAIAVRAAVELSGVAVTGAGQGITIDGSNVIIDRVWIHDTAASGIVTLAPSTSVTLKGSLIEKTRNTGAYVEASSLTIESSAIRDIAATATGTAGNGVQAQIGKDGKPSSVTVNASVIERTIGPAAQSYGSELKITGSLLREVKGRKDVASCVIGQKGSAAPNEPALSITSSLIEGCAGAGVHIDAGTLLFDRSTLRKCQPDAAGNLGLGLDASRGATITVKDSLIADTRLIGVIIGGSSGTLERTIVRDVAAQQSNGNSGIGIAVLKETGDPTVSIDQSAILHTHTVGVFAMGAKVDLLHSIVRDVKPEESSGKFGDGVESNGGATLSFNEGVIREIARAGFVVFGSSTTLQNGSIQCAAVDLTVKDATLDDRGGNVCGCDAKTKCAAQAVDLEPVSFERP
jgi:hypothetical protein